MILDLHAFPRTAEALAAFRPPTTIGAYTRYLEVFRPGNRLDPIPLDQQIAEMDASGVRMAVIYGVDLETTWQRKTSNESIAQIVGRYPDRFIGFAGVDPHKGWAAVDELDHAVRGLGLRGVGLDPFLHQVRANDPRYFPIYAKAGELGVPVSIHTSSHFDTSTPLDYGDPRHLDEAAGRFPSVTFIARHAGWPWIPVMIAVAWRHRNVYLDTSGFSPRHLDAELVCHMDGVLRDKVMFGTSYPLLSYERCVAEAAALPLRPENRRKFLWDNAARLLGLPERA